MERFSKISEREVSAGMYLACLYEDWRARGDRETAMVLVVFVVKRSPYDRLGTNSVHWSRTVAKLKRGPGELMRLLHIIDIGGEYRQMEVRP